MITTCNSVDTQLLASVSLFKSLYDQDKDIFDLLSIFVKYTINKKRMNTFTEFDVSQALKEEFCFDIPVSVLATTIRNRIKAKKYFGVYHVEIDQNEDLVNIDESIETAYKKSEKLLTQLEDYVSKKVNHILSLEEKNELYKNFCAYQLNNSDNGTYSNFISEFIIKCNADSEESINMMNDTLEGLVIYNGIMNSNNLNEIGLWRNKLTIFCDMDILFSFFGYNGSVFKEVISPLFKLVNEINCNPKTLNNIQLHFFSDTKKEIDRFFEKACLILEKRENIDPSKNAMIEILEGCRTRSDVLAKKAAFSSFLKQNGITEYNCSFYDDSKNNKYNIIDSELANRFIEKYGKEEDYISLLFNYINYINILRKGDNSKPLEQTKFVFLSSNSTLIKMDREIRVTYDENFPKAITPDNMITTLWFQLKKGFGNSQQSLSINVVNKAQIILSSKINLCVAKEYKSLSEQMASGKIDRDYAVEYLAELQNSAKRPEQITSEFLDENEGLFISSEDIEARIRESKFLKSRNNQLVAEISSSNVETLEWKQKYQDSERELNIYREKERKQNELRAERKRRRKNVLYLSLLVLLLIVSILLGCFNNISPIRELCAVIGIISSILTILGFLGITPWKIISHLKK